MPDFLGFGGFSPYAGVGIEAPNTRLYQPTTYTVIVPPPVLPVSLAFVRNYLKIPVTQISDDALITELIRAATILFQDFTNQILINTGFRTFADFLHIQYELRRSKLQTLDAFDYLVSGVFQPITNTLYYNTFEEKYSLVVFNDFQTIPENKDDRRQSVRIDFTSGYGATDATIPADIKIGLAQLVNYFYENRGDCSTCAGDCSSDTFSRFPASVQAFLGKYKDTSLYHASYRG